MKAGGWWKMQSGRNDLSVEYGLLGRGKGMRGKSEGICMFLNSLQVGSKASGKASTNTVSENLGKQ